MLEIETQRRHSEMAPELQLRLEDNYTSATLWVIVDGPNHLDRLDAVSVRVRDDVENRAALTRNVGTPIPEEQIAAQIWGPLQFRHGTDGGSADGRSVEPFRLTVGESKPLLMQPTVTPSWKDGAWWSSNTTANH